MDVSELRERLRDGKLMPSWEAVAAVGQSAWTLRRSNEWAPISSLLPEFKTQTTGGSRGSQNQGNGRRPAPPTFVVLKCVVCQTRIRLDVPTVTDTQVFRCKNCDTRYSVGLAESDGPALLIVPLFQNNERTSTARRRPAHIVAALRSLDLPHDSEWNTIRQRYRQLIVQYHPDKVRHLGDELQRLATQKTKEYNRVFEILEAFFDSQ